MGIWDELSSELSNAIQDVGKSVVTVQASGGRRASGIFLDEQTIVTTARAVADHETIRVGVSSQKPLNGTVVGSDSETDIGLLVLETKTGTPAVFSEGPKLAVGQLV